MMVRSWTWKRIPRAMAMRSQLRPRRTRSAGVWKWWTSTNTVKPTPFAVYFRGDPRENEAALREALPALYLSFRAPGGKE